MGLWTRLKLIFNVKTSTALDQAEDPREVMDYAYYQQEEFLRKVKQGLVEVSTAKHQLARQVQKQKAHIPQLDDQAQRAIDANRDDLARVALRRKQIAKAGLYGLEQQLGEVSDEEQRLIVAEQEIATRIEQFRTHRDVMTARYNAAEAQVRLKEALSGVSGDLGELSLALGRAEEKTQHMLARASALDSLIETGALEPGISGGDFVEVELQKISTASTIEAELAAMKSGKSIAELPPSTT
jgi:phage shock protein A